MSGHLSRDGRVGFFTDTSICIGCKACEVACKEWNGVPDDGLNFLGHSYDNTGELGANSWRHVAFIEQKRVPAGDAGGVRWLMSSDVCKHCTSAACLDVCPTGALFRTEFGSVVVQEDVCNGCGYCVPACPFGVIDQRRDDGRAWKCTLCYDRLRGGLEPACATACPTKSIQFGLVDDLRARARDRVDQLHQAGVAEARLYGADEGDGVGGMGAFFLLLDEPTVYGLPPAPVTTTRDLAGMWKMAAAAAATMVAAVAVAFSERGPAPPVTTYYDRPILKEPVWKWPVPAYFFTGGVAAGTSLLAAGARLTGEDDVARRCLLASLGATAVSTAFLVEDLGRPARFLNMLRVAKPTSPMSVGSWVLAAFGSATAAAVAGEVLSPGRLVGVAQGAAAALAPVLGTYTAVLVADTAVPAWHEAGRELPFLFAGGALASSGGLALLIAPHRAARRVAVMGAALEVAASHLLTRRLGRLADPYRRGRAGMLSKAASAAAIGGGLLAGIPGRRRRAAAVVGGTLLLAGAAAERFAVFYAGVESARDPTYTIAVQEQRAEPGP